MAAGQEVYLSRFAGGNFLKDNRHRIDIFNESENYRSMGGWLLVTRQYVARFPANTVIAPHSSLRLAKRKEGNFRPDLAFTDLKDFLIRIPERIEAGDYAVLFDPNLRIIDAFFFSPVPEPGFLPDEGELITFRQDKVRFRIPEAANPRWSSLQLAPDPAMVFIHMADAWQVTSRNRNLFPATEYDPPEAKYVDGIITLKWKSRFEQDCFSHRIERSLEGGPFREAGSVEGKGNTRLPSEYILYDDKVDAGKAYRYRIVNVDKFGNEVFSPEVAIRTEMSASAFMLEWFWGESAGSSDLNVRFSTRQPQEVRIKILDEQFREVAMLFAARLEANSPHLIKFREELPLGKYFLVADTDKRRVYREFWVGNP
jgi:hypothetical protein